MKLPPAALLRAAPAALLVGGAWAMAWSEYGSIAAGDWLPYAVLAALVVAVVAFSGGAVEPRRLAVVGIAGLVALAAWAAITAAWAASPSLARDEALLTAFYALAFAVPLLTLRGEGERLGMLGVIAAGAIALALATAVTLRFGSDVLDKYDTGRLAFPISYANAQAAVFLVAFWPSVVLATRRSLPGAVRAVAVGGAAALLCGWLLAQSKGGIVALALSAIVVFSLCPGRLRLLVPTAIAAGLTGAAAAPLTSPFRANGAAAERAAIGDAGIALLVVALAGVGLGFLYALADERVDVGPRTKRRAAIAVLGALAASALAGVVIFFAAVDKPADWFADRWHNFKRLPDREHTSSHLLSLGSNRYDFWRVSLKEFGGAPIQGIGARGFSAAYLQKGKSNETPARAHSLPIEVLAEQGLVGFALVLVGIGAPLWLTGRAARRGRASAIACLGAGTYFAAHALVDWTWTFPAVGVPAFLLLGIGASARNPVPLRQRLSLPIAIGGLVAAIVLFAPPWVSAKLVSRALDNESAGSELRWAHRLDPLSTAPDIARAQLAVTPRDAIPPLLDALGREPRSAALHYLLGTTYLDVGRRRDAVRELERAQALAPRDGFIADALRRARRVPSSP